MLRPLIRPIVRPLVRGVTAPSFGWSPRVLFAAGEQGAWYDPSDLSTLYQDSAGTTPVTALGQPVGLMLDKSKGLVRGPELVTNGGFDSSTTGWVANAATLSVEGGRLRVVCTGTGDHGARQDFPTEVGKTYIVSATMENHAAAALVGLRVSTTGYTNTVVSNNVATGATGPVGLIFTAVATTMRLSVDRRSASAQIGDEFYADNISVRELPGNHAYQTTGMARPTVEARVNLLVSSDDLTKSPWIAPTGAGASITNLGSGVARLTTAALGVETDYKQNVAGLTIGQTYTIQLQYRSDAFEGPLEISMQEMASPYPSTSQQVQPTSEWQTVSITRTFTTGTTGSLRVRKSSLYAGGQVELRFPQMELGSTPTTYQRVTSATDYADVGAKRYLQFDGVDDFLVTSAIDFTGTDKMTACFGARKLSDAGWQLIAGLSANPATVAGTFGVGCGTLNGDASRRTFGSFLFGSVSQLAGAGVFAAPYTGVLTCAYDLAQGTREAELVLRVNSAGTSPSYSAANAGDGSFGSHALYIGRTGGTANAFNGNLYSLLIRGAASTAAQIEAAERYAAAKTGVTLA